MNLDLTPPAAQSNHAQTPPDAGATCPHCGTVGLWFTKRGGTYCKGCKRPAAGRAPAAAATPAMQELKALPQWVGYDAAKVPLSVDGGRASSTNPATWSSYAAAVAKFGDRVGFVLTAADPYCVIDIDHCRDAATGEIEPRAQAVIDRFNSYTEVSPSGTGIHIWMRATKPGGRCRTGAVEVYSEGRFMTVTDKHLDGTPA